MKTNTMLKYVAIGMLLAWLIGIALGSACTWMVMHSNAPVRATDSPIETRSAEIWRITAYCPGKCCCGRYADYVTASGHMIAYGDKLIAAPKSIPFGTWIDIEGYGYAEVLDRGGAIKGKRLDLLFPTHQEALNWGVQYKEIRL